MMRPAGWSLPLSILALLSTLGCDVHLPDESALKTGLRELVLTELLHESAEEELFAGQKMTHGELIARLRKLADNEKVTGLFLRTGSFGGGWGRATDLMDALAAVRAANKPVHCHADDGDNLSFTVMATACDRITFSPSGMLNLVGVSAQLVHARKLLDSVGLKAEMMHVGKYKGAADMLTEETITDAARETWDELLGTLDRKLLAAVGKRLGTQDEARIREVIDQGPLTATDALRLGLIDDVEYDDEARMHAKQAAKTETVVRLPLGEHEQEMGFTEIVEAITSGGRKPAPKEPHLSVVTLTGTIVDGHGDGNPSAASVPFIQRMRRLGDDANVKAVLLRIDSPGGSAPASDRMWHAVARVAKRKPVVVSVGDMAASGGYYIACAATEIFAQETSLVGSIGVVGGKIAAADLAERIGLNVAVLKRGLNATWSSPLRTLEDSERAALMRLMTGTYELFLTRVQAGRKLSMEKVRAAAEGRVMHATRGLELGLLDQRGGMPEAMARARKLGNLPAESPIDVWPGPQNLLQRLGVGMGSDSDASTRAWSWLPAETRAPVIESVVVHGAAVSTVLPYAVTLR